VQQLFRGSRNGRTNAIANQLLPLTGEVERRLRLDQSELTSMLILWPHSQEPCLLSGTGWIMDNSKQELGTRVKPVVRNANHINVAGVTSAKPQIVSASKRR